MAWGDNSKVFRLSPMRVSRKRQASKTARVASSRMTRLNSDVVLYRPLQLSVLQSHLGRDQLAYLEAEGNKIPGGGPNPRRVDVAENSLLRNWNEWLAVFSVHECRSSSSFIKKHTHTRSRSGKKFILTWVTSVTSRNEIPPELVEH